MQKRAAGFALWALVMGAGAALAADAVQPGAPQLTEGGRRIAPPALTETPRAGELVRDEDGVLQASFVETQVCSWRGCRSYIYDKRTGNLAAVGGHWNKHYRKTGRGGEVVRVDAFSEEERPKAVDTADATGEGGGPHFEAVLPPPGFNPIDEAAKAAR